MESGPRWHVRGEPDGPQLGQLLSDQVTFARLAMALSHSHPLSPEVLMIQPQTSRRCPLGPASCHVLHSWVYATKSFLEKVRALPGYPAPSPPWEDGRGRRK